MNFKVPQFIEVEDKIFGPLTFKQFIYLIGGAGAAFLLWKFLPAFIAILLILPIVALVLALAFWKFNNRPFVIMVQSWLRYQSGGKLYIWKKVKSKKLNVKGEEIRARKQPQIQVPTMSESKLKDLAWSLDVNEHVNS